MRKALVFAAALTAASPAAAQLPSWYGPWCWRNTTMMGICAARLNAYADERDRQRGLYVPPPVVQQAPPQSGIFNCTTTYVANNATTYCYH